MALTMSSKSFVIGYRQLSVRPSTRWLYNAFATYPIYFILIMLLCGKYVKR
jgi:hypothetical protein